MADTITTELDSTPEAVKSVRQEMTGAALAGNSGGGVAIDRIPLNSSLEHLVKSGIFVKQLGPSVRCIRLVEVPHNGQMHCSRPTVNINGQPLCPDHDKAAFMPNQTQVAKGRVFNSASVPLSKSELAEMGKAEEPKYVEPIKPVSEPKVVAADPHPTGTVVVTLSLEDLDGKDLKAVLGDKIVAALDEMPATSIKRMKQVVAIQERVAKILGGSK